LSLNSRDAQESHRRQSRETGIGRWDWWRFHLRQRRESAVELVRASLRSEARKLRRRKGLRYRVQVPSPGRFIAGRLVDVLDFSVEGVTAARASRGGDQLPRPGPPSFSRSVEGRGDRDREDR